MNMRAFILSALSVAALGASGCWLLLDNSIELRNQSNAAITDIEADFAGKVVNWPAVAPGDSIRLHGRSRNEGEIILTYSHMGLSSQLSLGYISPPFTVSCKVTIGEEVADRECREN